MEGDTLVFPGTTMDEIENHLAQVRSVITSVNGEVERLEEQERTRVAHEHSERQKRLRENAERAERIAALFND